MEGIVTYRFVCKVFETSQYFFQLSYARMLRGVLYLVSLRAQDANINTATDMHYSSTEIEPTVLTKVAAEMSHRQPRLTDISNLEQEKVG